MYVEIACTRFGIARHIQINMLTDTETDRALRIQRPPDAFN